TATVALVSLVTLVGCTTATGPVDNTLVDRMNNLERENVARQQKITKLEGEVSAMRAERDELRQLLEAARELNKTGTVPADKPFRFEVQKVELGFLTCAIDLDGKKGDDAIAAYVNLYDQYDTSLKAAGTFRFDVFDLARSKDHVVRSWTFAPEEAAGNWQRFPGCYQFKLPLGGEVRAEKVVLKVSFSRPGKETLTATREVQLELP
ncbi:MAG TPA: hypothetical protein VMY39_01410, partial [Planctomycetota bacterium]|nr:hypothetical protein [Planctomycetota bacterium]